MPRLKINDLWDNTAWAVSLDRQVMSIGTAPSNDIVLNDHTDSVAEHHAKLTQIGGRYIIQDISGSEVGLIVNNDPLKEKALEDGDIMLVGDFSVTYSTSDEEDDVIEVAPASGHTRIYTPGGKSKAPEAPKVGKRISDSFEVILEISRKLSSETSLQAIFETAIDLTARRVNPDSISLIIIDPKTEKLKPQLIKLYTPAAKKTGRDKLPISSTVISSVLRKKVAILIPNVEVDDQLRLAGSIIEHSMKSIITVPLWIENRVIGILYAHSSRPTNQFTTDDLDILTAVGNLTAVAIERARLAVKLEKENRIRAHLSRFFSPGVVEHLVGEATENRDKLLGGNRMEATYMFVDIVDFTPFTERLDPDHMVKLLNDILGAATEIVFEYGGTLDKYTGDGLFAVFGAPISKKDDAKRAVTAALKILYSHKRMMEARPPDERQSIRIGINSGQCVAGNIGSTSRMEYTVLGDAVNTTARIEQVVPANTPVISEATYELVHEHFETELLGAFPIKGKRVPINLYKVIRSKAN